MAKCVGISQEIEKKGNEGHHLKSHFRADTLNCRHQVITKQHGHDTTHVQGCNRLEKQNWRNNLWSSAMKSRQWWSLLIEFTLFLCSRTSSVWDCVTSGSSEILTLHSELSCNWRITTGAGHQPWIHSLLHVSCPWLPKNYQSTKQATSYPEYAMCNSGPHRLSVFNNHLRWEPIYEINAKHWSQCNSSS